MQAMDWAALKRRGSASICDAVVPSEIACTRLIDSIHAGVKIACTATNAARSSRSLRARRISINPKTTAVSTVRAVATFATVERFTAPICSNAFRNHRSDDRSGYLYRFSCSCSLFLIRRIRLGKCQWGNHQTAERDNHFLHVRLLLLMHVVRTKLQRW